MHCRILPKSEKTPGTLKLGPGGVPSAGRKISIQSETNTLRIEMGENIQNSVE